MDKRTFLKASALSAVGAAITTGSFSALAKEQQDSLPSVKMNVPPISVSERKTRINKAQTLMQNNGFAAIILEPGPAMDYFTGIQWWRSERLVSVVIPAQGDIAVVCPFFEEPSIRESLLFGDDVRVWQEHESPFLRVKQILTDRGIKKGKVGFEDTVRYFVLAKTMEELNGFTHASAEPVTLGCRMFKSANELALMHKASEVTLAAYQHVYSQLKVGMTQADVKGLMRSTQAKLGGQRPWAMALFDEASAYPHGTKKEHKIKEGSIVLMDAGCGVHGYQSDISRTFVVGNATNKQRDVWNTVRRGQQIVFENARIGSQAGKVDDAVRKYYESVNFGPDYQLPGLSHRTGHGIGMQGHEEVNFVRGEQKKLAKGMCFSNEPGIYIPGEFGVRLEDCIYMGETGSHWFTEPPESIEKPLGKLSQLNV